MFELINANSYTALRMRFEPIEPKQVDDDLLIFLNSHCHVLNWSIGYMRAFGRITVCLKFNSEKCQVHNYMMITTYFSK